jgi:hypothetical protein
MRMTDVHNNRGGWDRIRAISEGIPSVGYTRVKRRISNSLACF